MFCRQSPLAEDRMQEDRPSLTLQYEKISIMSAAKTLKITLSCGCLGLRGVASAVRGTETCPN